MHFSRFLPLSFVLWSVWNLAAGKSQEVDLLENAMNALYNALQYMEDHVTEINLDGALGCRFVEGSFHALLESKLPVLEKIDSHFIEYLEVMRIKADRIAEEAKQYVKISGPEYYANVGGVLERSKVLIWYPSRLTKPALVVQPLPCSESHFNESYSDSCLKEILYSRSEEIYKCELSDGCLEFMTSPRKRGYMITHQVLYFQIMEREDCVKRSRVKAVSKDFQDTLCSNIMRDAEDIAASGYPVNHRDLFMEQIGLCGIWGYKDFYKPEWLLEILQWQQPSGCYANRVKWYCTENLLKQKIRKKREERMFKDGCLSHKTGVALIALAAHIRFIIEEMSEM